MTETEFNEIEERVKSGMTVNAACGGSNRLRCAYRRRKKLAANGLVPGENRKLQAGLKEFRRTGNMDADIDQLLDVGFSAAARVAEMPQFIGLWKAIMAAFHPSFREKRGIHISPKEYVKAMEEWTAQPGEDHIVTYEEHAERQEQER